jgi:hypothetical protein
MIRYPPSYKDPDPDDEAKETSEYPQYYLKLWRRLQQNTQVIP